MTSFDRQLPRLTTFTKLSTIVIIPSLLSIFYLEKGDVVIALNQLHNSFFDTFFRYYTHLASGWCIAFIAVICLFIKYRLTLIAGLIGLFQALTSVIFKGILFPHAPRPMTFFQDSYPLDLVEGVTPLFFRSFPSGHTMTAFGLAAFLSCFAGRWLLQIILLGYATLIAISRMYLALHFLGDVVVGAILGIVITATTILISDKIRFLNRFPLEGRLKF